MPLGRGAGRGGGRQAGCPRSGFKFHLLVPATAVGWGWEGERTLEAFCFSQTGAFKLRSFQASLISPTSPWRLHQGSEGR